MDRPSLCPHGVGCMFRYCAHASRSITQALYHILLTEDGVQCRSFAMPDHGIWYHQQIFEMCCWDAASHWSPRKGLAMQAYPCSVCSSPTTSSSAAQLGAARMRTTVRGDSIALCGKVDQGLPGPELGRKLATYLLSESYCSHSHLCVWPATLMISPTAGGLYRLHLRLQCPADSHPARCATRTSRCGCC